VSRYVSVFEYYQPTCYQQLKAIPIDYQIAMYVWITTLLRAATRERARARFVVFFPLISRTFGVSRMREAGIAYKRSAGCLGPHRHAAPSPASPTPSRPWPCTPRRLAVARRVGGPSRPRETVVWRTRSPQSAYGTMHKAPSTRTRCVCRHIVAIRSVSVVVSVPVPAVSET